MPLIERLIAAAAVFVAAHFAVGFINASAGGSVVLCSSRSPRTPRPAGSSGVSTGCWGFWSR